MISLLDTQPKVSVSDAEYLRLLGYPAGHVPGDRVRELMAWARSWFSAHGRPWIYLREAALETGHGALTIDGIPFHSGQLRDHLRAAHASRVVLVAVSAGRACEEEAQRLWQDSRPDDYFFLEVLGSAVVEHLVASVSGRLCAAAEAQGLVALPHYSPGYAGWDVAEQGALYSLISQKLEHAFPETLDVLPSGMLRPKKSLLAVVGLTARTRVSATRPRATPCEACSFSPCQYRRSPYVHAAVRVDGAPLQAGTPAPRYTVNARALRTWSAERVRFEPREDGTLVAYFRFDGTTCSNMGHSLAFEYRVVLSPEATGRIILEAGCQPVRGDTGHTKMCAYIADAPRLMDAITTEKPLLGQPLATVLSWEREPVPSGCFCEARGRTHKWGIALEVIHHAITHAGALASAVSMLR